jgi:sialate O-acetylesterase
MYGRNIRLQRWSVVVLCVAMLGAAASADIRLPSVLSDNMVLQAGGRVPIWGWADPNEEIAIRVSWRDGERTINAGDDGKWMFKLTTPEVGGPYEMTLTGKNAVTIKNILVGEVWLCSGQSNMEMPVRLAANAEQESAAAGYPKIRLFTVRRKVADKPQDNCAGKWVECSPETVGNFSAAGYYFGRELHKVLDVPVGLIHSSWGGTPAEAWTGPAALETDFVFEPIMKRHKEMLADYPKLKEEYLQKMEQWRKDADKAVADGNPEPPRPPAPLGPNNPNAPGVLYNGMIAPLIPYAVCGVIWYQGESNADRAYQYREVFPDMIKSWWSAWPQGTFPFLFVQLANWRQAKPEPSESDWAELREAQLMALDLGDTGMAVAIDIGDANDIHPKNKQEVGRRLALWALAKTYGKDVVYSGPLYRSFDQTGNEIVVHFDHADGGLIAKDGGPLKGFAIAGQDHAFVWADAKIKGDTVVVSSEKVSEPAAVRYAWADNPACNLCNKAGLPASPFRTDTWPGITLDKR